MKMEWKGCTTTAMETMNTEEVDSPLMASGISTAASASMSSCALKKRGMNHVYKGSLLKSLKAFYEPVRLSEFEQGQMNLAPFCALIAGGVSFNFVETYHFQEFMKLVKPSFKIPSQKHMTDHYLVQLYVEATVKQDEQLGKLDCHTMLWNGWTDVSNNSIYVLMLLHSMNKSEIIDIVNVSSEHHQSEFLLKTTKEILAQCPVNMNVIKCVVTDSPTPMLKYRHLLNAEYSHIVPRQCTLHVANLLTKDICRMESLMNIVKGNCKISCIPTMGKEEQEQLV